MMKGFETMTKREIAPDRFAERSGRVAAPARARQHKETLRPRSVESELPLKKPEDLKVFISLRDSKCDECGEQLGRKAWIKSALNWILMVLTTPGIAALA
jgi:hypothetical protein